MAFDISEFRAITHTGFQKVNRFKIRLPIPPCLGQSVLETVRFLEFYGNTADLPGVSLATRPIVRYGYGVHEKKPGFPVFNDIMLTFLADANSNNLTFFQDWIACISNFNFSGTINNAITLPGNGIQSSVYELAYKEEYVIDAKLTLFDNHGNEKYDIWYRDFYPISIPEIKMQWEPVQQMMQIVVMFTFFDWYTTDPVGTSGNVTGLISGNPGAGLGGGGNPTGSVSIGDVQITQ